VDTDAALSGDALKFAQSEGFEDVVSIVQGRCSMCHAREPYWEGIGYAPKGVHLESESDIARMAEAIFLQAGVTNAMPPGNLSYIEDAERATIRRWYRGAVGQVAVAAR